MSRGVKSANRTIVLLAKADKCGRIVWTRKNGDSALTAMVSQSEYRWAFKWAVLIVGLTCLPYLLAWWLAPAGTQYTGLLINHFDGESYYAKMQQGARGDWLFHLAFTPESHDGAFIFTFYLALGHLAGATGLPIPLVYHLARVVAGLFSLLVAYRFIAHFLDRVPTRRIAFLLLGFSAGFGWLLAPLGVTTSDLWVAEGFTFLSILANPHFPLAIGLMLLIFLIVLEVPPTAAALTEERSQRGQPLISRLLAVAGLGLLLSIVQPFAVPIVIVVLGVYLTLLAWHGRFLPRREILIAGAAVVGGAPFMLYDWTVYRTNPALAAWSAQNLTPSLPPWNYALGYGLVLLLALGGTGIALRRRDAASIFLLAWVASVLVLLYVPFALQRRFITGLHVPLTLLAAIALEQILWPRLRSQRQMLVTGLLIGFTALTNAFVPLVAVAGVAQGQAPLVMTHSEAAAWAWLHANTTWTDTVLAPPEVGQFIPAWAGNRVVYGHPFETIDAETKQAEVADFYSPAATTAERSALLDRYQVRYVWIPVADPAWTPADLAAVWSSEEGVLYHRMTQP
jgi:hypothetical protein